MGEPKRQGTGNIARSHCLVPVLVRVPNTNDHDGVVVLDDIDDQMRLVRMNAYGRSDFRTLTREAGIGDNQGKYIKQLAMIAKRLLLTKQGNTDFGDPLNVLLGSFR